MIWIAYLYFGIGLYLGIAASLTIYRHKQRCPAHKSDWVAFDTFMLFALVFAWPLTVLWAFTTKSAK